MAAAATAAVAVSKAGYRAPKAVIARPDTPLAYPTAAPFIEPIQIENVFQSDRRPYDRPPQQAVATSLMALPPRAHHDLPNNVAGATNLVTGTQRRYDDQPYAVPGGGHVVDDGTVTAASTTASDQYSGLLILHEAAKRLHPVMRPLLSATATTTATSSPSPCTTSSMVDHHDHQHDQHLQSAITVDPLPFESVFSMARIHE
jgi:hypothetical protein